MGREAECNKGMRKNIFKGIGNIRKMGSKRNVKNLTLENVRNVNENNRRSIVGGEIC